MRCTASLAQAGRNFPTVLTIRASCSFLLIFTGYWIVYWQEFITFRLHSRFINPIDTERLLATGPIVVILLTVIITALMRKVPALTAIAIGTLITALGWIVLILIPTGLGAVLTLIAIALGEITQSPRYYEYISRLAPSGQQGTYMGFAFLPLGIGSLIGGKFGGYLIHYYGEVKHEPSGMWWVIMGVGVFTAVLGVTNHVAAAVGIERVKPQRPLGKWEENALALLVSIAYSLLLVTTTTSYLVCYVKSKEPAAYIAARIRTVLKNGGSAPHSEDISASSSTKFSRAGGTPPRVRKWRRLRHRHRAWLPHISCSAGEVLEEKVGVLLESRRRTGCSGSLFSWIGRITSWADHDALVHYLIGPMVAADDTSRDCRAGQTRNAWHQRRLLSA